MAGAPKRRPGRPRLHPEEEALTDRVALRAPPTLRARLDGAARANNRSLSTEAQFRLERSFSQDDALAGPARHVLQHIIAAFGPDTDVRDEGQYLAAMARAIEALIGRHPRPGGMRLAEWNTLADLVALRLYTIEDAELRGRVDALRAAHPTATPEEIAELAIMNIIRSGKPGGDQ